MQDELHSVQGTSIKGITKEELLSKEVMITQIEEQKKIGTYFSELDHLITLHQWKCRFLVENEVNDWEQRKLEDYLYVSSQKNKEEKYGKEDVLSVSGDYGIVNQIEFQGRSFAGVSVANYGVVEKGDIVYTKSPLKANPYGIIKTNKGKTGIVSTLYVVYKPNKNTNSEFVQVYFEQDARMNSYMHPLVNKGAKNDMKVSAKNALQGNVIFPKIQEQKQISIYFKTLDHLITLHQWKCLIYVKIEIYDKNHRKLIKIVIIFEFILVFIFAFMLIHIRMLYFSIRYILLRFTGVINVIMVVKIIVLIVIIGDDVYGRIRIDN